MTGAEVGRGHTGRAGCAAIVPVTGRAGGRRQEELAALCITQQWRQGPNPNSLPFFRAGTGSTTWMCAGIPAPKVRSAQLAEFYPSLDAPTKGEQEEN